MQYFRNNKGLFCKKIRMRELKKGIFNMRGGAKTWLKLPFHSTFSQVDSFSYPRQIFQLSHYPRQNLRYTVSQNPLGDTLMYKLNLMYCKVNFFSLFFFTSQLITLKNSTKKFDKSYDLPIHHIKKFDFE